jgi:hypothetical protein
VRRLIFVPGASVRLSALVGEGWRTTAVDQPVERKTRIWQIENSPLEKCPKHGTCSHVDNEIG